MHTRRSIECSQKERTQKRHPQAGAKESICPLMWIYSVLYSQLDTHEKREQLFFYFTGQQASHKRSWQNTRQQKKTLGLKKKSTGKKCFEIFDFFFRGRKSLTGLRTQPRWGRVSSDLNYWMKNEHVLNVRLEVVFSKYLEAAYKGEVLNHEVLWPKIRFSLYCRGDFNI